MVVPVGRTQVIDVEMCYQRGECERAIRDAERLIAVTSDEHDRMALLTTHMMASISTGDAVTAYGDLLQLVDLCSKGLASSEDEAAYSLSLLAALRIEAILAADFFDQELIEAAIVRMPAEFKQGVGPLLALRLFRQGRFQQAAGIAYACQVFAGDFDQPLGQVVGMDLHIVMAATNVIEGRVDEAREDFEKAWRMGIADGIVMPFVELHFLLFCLHKQCGEVVDAMSPMYRSIEPLVSKFFKGWFTLRELCGLSHLGSNLTPLEWYVAELAALGWSNKEIAKHLGLALDTVKHQFTSVYQKLGISKRTEIAPTIRVLIDESTPVVFTELQKSIQKP